MLDLPGEQEPLSVKKQKSINEAHNITRKIAKT